MGSLQVQNLHLSSCWNEPSPVVTPQVPGSESPPQEPQAPEAGLTQSLGQLQEEVATGTLPMIPKICIDQSVNVNG